MTGSSDAVLLTQALRGFQRRLRRVLAFRVFWLAGAAAVVVGEALALLLGTAILHGVWLLGGAMGAAVLVSALGAVLRAPSLVETARLLDRRRSLQNRAATALQFVEHKDLVSALVLRDAARRVSALDPAVVFPLEYPGRPRLLVASVVACSLLFAFAVTRGTQPQLEHGPRSAGIVIPGGPAQARQGSPARPQADTPAATAPQGSTLTPVPGAAQAQAGERSRTAATLPREPPAPGDTPAGSPAASPRGNQGDSAAVPPQRSQPAAHQAGSDRADTGGVSAASHAREARAAPGTREGAGRGGSAPGPSTRAGGGVKAGVLDAGPTAAGAQRPTGRSAQNDALEYQAAWTRAQAAIAQDRVPPELREYVRRYFAAIRSPKRP